MANRLLDYKFWCKEIKRYPRFRSNFTPPKALEFSGYFDMERYIFEEFDLVDYNLVQIDKFIIHDNPLEDRRIRNRENDLYIKNAEWNILKWNWYPKIIEETVNGPILRDLMSHIPNFYEEIDVIRMFINDIDIDGTNLTRRRREFRPREMKINSLSLRYMFYSKPKNILSW
jgi:hypothetical protein